MTPLVSVVVPAFRNVRHLAATLDSILAQQFHDFELVVADHSSGDGTDELLAGYAGEARIRVLTPTPPGGGAVANWNRVSQAARGQLIKLVCGDDLVSHDSVARQVECFEAHPSVVLVAGRRDLIDSEGRRLLSSRGLGRLAGLTSGGAVIRACVRAGTNLLGEPGCVMMRRDVLERVGWWDARFPYLIDQATYARVLLHGDAYALRRIQASFRISADQWSVRLADSQAQQAIAFHESLHALDPALVSAADLRMGHWRAKLMARTRRAAYHWFRRRM